MKIIIAGAGLGGLAAAYIFAKDGHDVQVLEQRHELSKKGTGLMIRPGASRVLKSWGLEDNFEQVSDASRATVLRDLRTGNINMRNIAVDISEFPDWGIERQVLQQVLYENALKVGAIISFNVTVEDIGDDEHHAWVKLKDGRTLTADLLLSADGVRSRLRRKILSDVSTPIDPLISNVTLSGMAVPLSDDSVKRDLAPLLGDNSVTIWTGETGFLVGRYNQKSGHWGGLFGMKNPQESANTKLWDEEGDIEQVRAHFTDLAPALRTALNIATTCDRWKLCEMPTLPRWSSRNGRMVLLGDSAHAMHPNAAQGFSQIVEDVGVLRYLLQRSQYGISKSIPTVVSDWEKIRMPRVERIKGFARWNTDMFMDGRIATKAADGKDNFKSLKHVKPDMNAKFSTSAFLKWTQDYDAVGEAAKYVDARESKESRL